MRRSGRGWASTLLLSLALWASQCASALCSRAWADDWAEVLPACAHPPPATVPQLELVYPRTGLPALVHAGELLVARVRLPVPLTPPPGVQQARALAGWHASLVGAGLASATTPARSTGAEVDALASLARHEAPVIDVRPDGPQSLVYRVSIAVPAWLAPGTYDLSLVVPHGKLRALGLVRVLRPGAPPRLAWASPALDGLAPEERARLPVDVWLQPPGASPGAAPSLPADEARSGAPTLELVGTVAGLRVGPTLRVLGDCADAHLPYDGQLSAALRRHGLERASLVAPRTLSTDVLMRIDGTQLGPLRTGALRFERGLAGATWRLAADAGAPVEATMLWLPRGGARIEGSGAQHDFYPAGEIATASNPAPASALSKHAAALALRVVLQPGGHMRVESASAPAAKPWHVALSVSPRPVVAGAPLRIALSDAPGGTRFALRAGVWRTAFAADARLVERRPGLRPLLGLAITPDGRRQPLRGEIEVIAARAGGCSVSTGGPPAVAAPRNGLPWGTAGLWLLALLLKRRRRSRVGNRLRAGRRLRR